MYTTGCFFLNLLYWFKITTLSAGMGMVELEHSYITLLVGGINLYSPIGKHFGESRAWKVSSSFDS